MQNSTKNIIRILSMPTMQKIDVVHLSTASQILALIEKQGIMLDEIRVARHKETEK